MNRSRCGFSGGKDLVQQVGKRRGRTEQVALRLVALFRDEELCLRLGLHTLGNDAQAKRMAERDGGAAHRARLVIVADFFDERSIDEDSVERRAAHLSERHVAGAEVVDEHANTVTAKLVQGCETGTSRRQHLLGDLEIEV